MKKIITAIAFIALTTVSAKAVDFGNFSVTAGLGSNSSVWGASGTERGFPEAGGSVNVTNKEHGVFTDEYSNHFIEVGIGQYFSLGYNMADTIATPRAITNEGQTQNEASAQVDFNDFETTYLKVNIPGGMFVKYGQTTVEIKVNETTADGGTYADRTSEGESIGLGYQGHVGDTGLGFRIETNYVTFDDVTTDNGVALAAGTPANGGRNEVKVNNMEGVTAMFALTYTLGRN
tara:strand:- start:467 stop:1165 length:699 start_codon:yes stop_codon:yes gene_type:complete